MQTVVTSFFRAVWSQLHIRMLLLTLMPFGLSILIWGVVLWLGLQPLFDWIHARFLDGDGFHMVGTVLGWFGSDAIQGVIVPLVAMWVLLPLMIMTALFFIGTLAMPAIARFVGTRDFPALERRGGGSIGGSAWISLWSLLVFLVQWLVTLPLALIPGVGFVLHLVLWGWLTFRVLAYDALAAHADRSELKSILREHRWPLLTIGAVTGAMGAAPTLIWMGGALSVVFFPVLAAISIWLYVLVFVFTGLWFEHYCLDALQRLRMQTAPVA